MQWPVEMSPSRVCFLAALLAAAACVEETPDELDVLPPLGKEDSASVGTLPVQSFATEAWAALNRWEDTDTPAARKAGVAWKADSGLNWDEKYALWIESLPIIDSIDGFGQTFEIITPFGKRLPAPKLDCADVTLLLRSSFAAWYNLPFIIIGSDGGTPVFMGHVGIRTPNGNFQNMPLFKTEFADHSAMPPAQYMANWPKDNGLRALGIQDGDDQPFLGPGARTGTYLDEMHLNKRAARLIRMLLTFSGSMHVADSRNTYNLVPDALRAGDTNLWRWQAQGVGHTMVTMRADRSVPGIIEAQSVFGNLPPAQPVWNDPVTTMFDYTDARAGGRDDETDYAPLGGGLKRWRVAKDIGGTWRNTVMDADVDNRINSTDLDRIRERPRILEGLLAEPTPEARRDALLGVIESKRQHLRKLPASCSAREARENAFEALYDLMESEFGMSKLEVDREFRAIEDYVFAELEYQKSRTCCWNSTTPQMFDTIMDLDDELRRAAPQCGAPLVFKARNRGYDIYRQHNPIGWKEWSADEECPQKDTAVDDVEAPSIASPFCSVFGTP